ncbi:inactive serine/threonine-protein kinase TEX14 isoform X1 [Anolis carolinensis]|uniref:inactive serine/threonine-protein kinase TEX14 isoform X1 n=1 Tax=Anolis carolinensis TaxID=28377 RepID=UPI002F2B52AD
MAHALPIPCPVQIGTVRNESLEARLHEFVKQGNYAKVKKLLKKGISVNAVNSLGQTPLFTASLLGLEKLVDILLDYGSDPNHRCYDGSTPVHAAAFSGDQSILSKLLDAGGDLRVHDKNGRNPQSWAVTAGKDISAQMLEFIQRCRAHMQAALQSNSFGLFRKVDSPKGLVFALSKFGGITQGTSDSPLGRLLKRGNSPPPNFYSFGYGKFYLTGGKLGCLASFPIIADKEISQADDEPTFSFAAGPYMTMTSLMWRGSQVTVKELNMKPHPHCSKLCLFDLLLAEQEYSSKLRHPHLLQLMAVCLSSDLEKTRLVFERVNFGSLYSILHERRSEFPIIHMETIVHILLQVSDALRFLHSCGFVHRTVSSYAVVIVLPGEAKLTNLEYMIESKDGGEHSDLTRVPIPSQLYKWCAPEVILERPATTKSDIYSFCVLMQEALTETIPWDGFEGSDIRNVFTSGQWLEADARLHKSYYDIVKIGLEPRPKPRTISLQDIRYALKTDLKDLLQPHRNCGPLKTETPPDINICLPSASVASLKIPEAQEEPDQTARSFTTVSRCAASCDVGGAVVHDLRPAVRMAQSSPVLDPSIRGDASDASDSLCSFVINEIYTCYSDLCEEGVEDEEEEELRKQGPKTQRELQTDPRDRAETQSPEPTKLQNWQRSLSEESNSDTEAECQEEELEFPQSPAGQTTGYDSNRGKMSLSSFEQSFGKCVLTLTICQTKLREATESLCRTENLLDIADANPQWYQLFPRAPQEQPRSTSASLQAHAEKVNAALRNLKVPYAGDRVLLWKAVGPPSRNYIPPPLRSLDNFQPVVIPSFQVLEKECKDSQSQDTTCWSDFGLEVPEKLGGRGGAEPNYQVLHPGVTIRRKKTTSPQPHCGSPKVDGANASEGFSSKSIPAMYEASLRREERRMVQPEWTMEVKQMAKKTASGHLGHPAQYPPSSGWTSESETESQQSPSSREQFWRCPPNTAAGRQQIGCGVGDHKLFFDSEEEKVPKRTAGTQSQSKSSQFPTKKDLMTCGVTLRKNAALSVAAEDLCKGRIDSPSSSLDVSEEFLTPDEDLFIPLAPQENLEFESSAVEEDLEITQILCGQDDLEVSQEICLEHPITTVQDSEEKWLPCSAEAKHLNNGAPGGDSFAARSFADIQDLSSISGENMHSPKVYKTPKSTHSPTDASTPISPATAPPRFFSTVVKSKDRCVMKIDTTCWPTQEGSFSGLSTFTTATEKGKSVELPSADFPELDDSLVADIQSLVCRGQKKTENKLPSIPQRGVPEQGDSKEQEPEEITLNKCKADCSLCIDETSCLEEETERAHSSLDNILELVLGPTADSRSSREKPPDPVKRRPSHTDLRNIEMKGGVEDSFSESEGSTENAEGVS